MSEAPDEAMHRMLDASWAAKDGAREIRAAVRCGMGDAAGLCDALADIIKDENRTRKGNGPPSKRGRELAAVARRCGDAIWRMRDHVKFPREPAQ